LQCVTKEASAMQLSNFIFLHAYSRRTATPTPTPSCANLNFI